MGISQERVNDLRANWKCLLICFAMSLANCQYGFDISSVAGFQAMVGFLQVFGYKSPKSAGGWAIRTTPQQLLSSFLNVGTIVGSLATIPFTPFLGRKPGIWVGSLISFAAVGIQVAATTLPTLYGGRFLLGVSNGYFITFANIYTSETSPAHLRGFFVSFFGIWVNFGQVLGAIVDNYSKTHVDKLSYQIPLAVLCVIPFLLSILIIFIPESPRWLLVHNEPDKARKALLKLRGNSLKPEFFEEEFVEMQRGIEQEKELASSAGILDLFKGTDLRRTIICLGVIVSHTSSGLWLIIAYGTYFFQTAGVNKPFIASVINTCGGLAGVFVGLYCTLKLLGRRPMMLLAHGLCACFMLAMGIAYSVAPNSKATGRAVIALTVLWSFFYNGFSGPLSWPIATELVSSRLRVPTMAVCTAVNYLFAWLAAYTAPYFLNATALNWGPKYTYVWAGSNFVTFAFFLFFLPETKGRTLEEIDELFENRVSRRDFPTYQCVSSERAREIVQEKAHLKEGNLHTDATHTEEV